MFPQFPRDCLKHFYMNKDMERSKFCERVRSSRNHPNSIGIHQESLISNLGIIKTPSYHKILLTNQESTKHLNFVLPYFGPYWP